ncbi:hypothetical protein [Maricaulis sp. CAU 1757]
MAVLLGLSACAGRPDMAEGEPGQRARLMAALPGLPSMPELPTIKISQVSLPGTNRQAPQIDPALEPVIYWRVIEDDILIIHADTRGCTARSDFVVHVEQYDVEVFTVSLLRAGEDACDRDLPWGTQLGFGFEELGVPSGGRIVVLNPLDERPWDWNEVRVQTAARRAR